MTPQPERCLFGVTLSCSEVYQSQSTLPFFCHHLPFSTTSCFMSLFNTHRYSQLSFHPSFVDAGSCNLINSWQFAAAPSNSLCLRMSTWVFLSALRHRAGMGVARRVSAKTWWDNRGFWEAANFMLMLSCFLLWAVREGWTRGDHKEGRVQLCSQKAVQDDRFSHRLRI